MSLKELFGKKLKQVRKTRGFSQQQLAELCDMQTPSIGLIETGKRCPSFSTIEILAEILNVKFAELFDFDEDFTLDKSEDYLKSKLGHIVDTLNKKQLNYLIENAISIKKFFK